MRTPWMVPAARLLRNLSPDPTSRLSKAERATCSGACSGLARMRKRRPKGPPASGHWTRGFEPSAWPDDRGHGKSASSTVQKRSLWMCGDRWKTQTMGLSSIRSDEQIEYHSNARYALCSGAGHDLAGRDEPRDDLRIPTKRRATACCRKCADVLPRCAAHSRGTLPDLSSCRGNCACAIRNLRTNAALCSGDFGCGPRQVHAAVVCRSPHRTFLE